jgi:rhamnulokinase
MVGGGIANKLLCQFTADACGIPVYAGADQCTAMGNGLCQALAIGALTDRSQIREVMRNSCELTTYEPRNESLWQDKRSQYQGLQH